MAAWRRRAGEYRASPSQLPWTGRSPALGRWIGALLHHQVQSAPPAGSGPFPALCGAQGAEEAPALPKAGSSDLLERGGRLFSGAELRLERLAGGLGGLPLGALRVERGLDALARLALCIDLPGQEPQLPELLVGDVQLVLEPLHLGWSTRLRARPQ